MTCTACGRPLPEDSAFCEFCGANLKPVIAPNAYGPSASAIAGMSGQLIKSLSLGEKFSAAGALAAAVGFFLPWYSTADLASMMNKLMSTASAASPLGISPSIGSTSFSGLDVAKLWGAVYLILGMAIASGVLFFISSKATPSKRITISGFQVVIGSLFGPLILFQLLFVPFMQSITGMGLWLIGLGFCSVASGALITLHQLSKNMR